MFSVSQSSSYTIVQNIKHKMSRYYKVDIQYLLFVNQHWTLYSFACLEDANPNHKFYNVNVNVVVVI